MTAVAIVLFGIWLLISPNSEPQDQTVPSSEHPQGPDRGAEARPFAESQSAPRGRGAPTERSHPSSPQRSSSLAPQAEHEPPEEHQDVGRGNDLNMLRFRLELAPDIATVGDVYCGLFDESGWPWEPREYDIRSTDTQQLACEFPALAPGRYAAAVFLDHNDNSQLDRSWFGMPLEPWALSQGIRPTLPLPPDFDDVSFDFKGGTKIITLKLRS